MHTHVDGNKTATCVCGRFHVIDVIIGGKLSDDISTHQQPMGLQEMENQSEMRVTLILDHWWVNHMWFDQHILVKTLRAVVWSCEWVTQKFTVRKAVFLKCYWFIKPVLASLRLGSQTHKICRDNCGYNGQIPVTSKKIVCKHPVSTHTHTHMRL